MRSNYKILEKKLKMGLYIKNKLVTESNRIAVAYFLSRVVEASKILPSRDSRNGIEKDWWTPELTQLKNKSIEIHALWVQEGRPRQGQTFHHTQVQAYQRR